MLDPARHGWSDGFSAIFTKPPCGGRMVPMAIPASWPCGSVCPGPLGPPLASSGYQRPSGPTSTRTPFISLSVYTWPLGDTKCALWQRDARVDAVPDDVMDVLCAADGAAGVNGSSGGGAGEPPWLRSPCHGHVLNAIFALTTTYLSVLLLMCLRCSGRAASRGRGAAGALRPLVSLALLACLCAELAEAMLALVRHGPGRAAGPLAAAACSAASWLPAELLDAHLSGTLRLLPVACEALMSAARFLSVVQMRLWDGVTFDLARPTLGLVAGSLYLALSVVDVFMLRGGRRRQTRGAQGGARYSSYRYKEAGLYSKATFSWLTPLLRLGNSSPLELEDLGRIPAYESTALHHEKFQHIYNSIKGGAGASGGAGGAVPLWKCFLLFSGRMLALSGIFKLSGDMVGLMGPMGISVIVLYVQNVNKDEARPQDMAVSYVSISEFFSNGYVMGMLVFISALAQGTFSQSSTHLINVEGIRIKSALQAMIYDKSLKLPLWSFSEGDITEDVPSDKPCPSNLPKCDTKTRNKKDGEQGVAGIAGQVATSHTDFGTITNLMSEDTYNVMSFIWICHYVWAIPVKIGVLMFLLHYQLGVSALIGAVICVALMTPLQFAIGKRMSANSKSISEANDERLRRINEVLHGIKVIKLSGWEEQYERKVQLARNTELRLLNVDSLHWAVMTFLTHASSAIVTLITFGIYMVVERAPLPTASVFASLALFNQLTVPLFIFPITVPIIISALVSTRRLQAFFSKPETTNVLEAYQTPVTASAADTAADTAPAPAPAPVTPGDPVNGEPLPGCRRERSPVRVTDTQQQVGNEADAAAPSGQPTAGRGSVVSISDGNFSWSSGHVLNFTDVAVPKGGITLVVGAIGSGKTSLLLALLGEMSSSDGRYPVRWSQDSSVAYCSQRPWLLNANVRENVLFGQPLRRARYAEVIAACALQPDLDILPAQDLTDIGERGINLSGGQKHRVAIARALYSNATTVLMDDPLSALDYQVGQHLVEEGFQKLLRQRGRTLILATHCLSLLNQADWIIVMERGRVSVQGSLAKVQSERPDLAQSWQRDQQQDLREPKEQDALAAAAPQEPVASSGGDRTARERWQLVRLVSRIGLQQRAAAEEPAPARHGHRPYRRFSRRQSRSLYRSTHCATHAFPLPLHEFQQQDLEGGLQGLEGLEGLEGAPWTRPLRRTRSTIASAPEVWRRKVTRVSSLQPHDAARRPWRHQAWLAPAAPAKLDRESSAAEEPPYPTSFSFLPEADGEDSVTAESAVEHTDADRQSVVEVGRRCSRVPHRVYYTYAKACTLPVFLAYFISTVSWQGLRVCTDFWLSDWTAFNGTKAELPHNHNNFQTEMLKYLSVYSLLCVITMLLSLSSNLVGQLAGARARHHLHRNLLSNLLRCPIKFFDTTPIGRVIECFSTDIAVIDKKLATSIQRLMQFLSLCLSAVIVNAILSPWFLLPALPMCLAYYIIQHFYRVSTRELHRMDSITRAPVSSFFSETLGGLATIRAFGQRARFMETMLEKMDINNNTFLVLSAANRWLGVALDYMGGTIVLVSVIGSLIAAQKYPGVVSASLVGLAINYTLLVPIYLNWVVKFLADVEMYMGSVERVQQYADMPGEEYNNKGMQVSPSWPEYGEIQFKNVSLRYDINRDPVIRHMTLHIPAGQKIGLCGRTGSGKSSLVMSLFRMLDVSEGSIILDGVDITKLPLQLLRTRLSVIPQDIVMFSGTIRDNLDPNHLYTDEKIWNCLELAQLRCIVEALPGGLSSTVKEGGENLSVGTRQLFCLARAILQNAAVLVMDEATSSVDPGTEKAFLSVALSAFAHRTVIIIAHRLSTLLDCDRIIVLECGKVIEDGSPSQLLRFDNGVFSLMLKAAS
ncbi:ATP-binding cassette sub-family C member Sur [Frankliniella fusca]|uniref:ATP-binding cassette sub-family C member Sur n=1 Tax=Frankliniella fusca TaxID=407009 RepID=A0AAE1HD53_9NEOP|nr:ATP-binding cassette sub-family C member Sur [Frankliniella fusca]